MTRALNRAPFALKPGRERKGCPIERRRFDTSSQTATTRGERRVGFTELAAKYMPPRLAQTDDPDNRIVGAEPVALVNDPVKEVIWVIIELSHQS